MSFRVLLASTALSVAMATSAMATVVNVDGDSAAIKLVGDTNIGCSPCGLGSAILTAVSGTFGTHSSSSTNQWKSPTEGGTSFYSVQGSNSAAQALFSTVQSSLSFVWGTPDPELGRNRVSFFNGSTLVGFFDGSYLYNSLKYTFGSPASPFNNSNAAATPNFLATISVAGGFNKVVFSNSGSNAFEFQEVSGSRAVPGPVAGAGLPFLLAGAALWMRRRNSRIA